MSSRCDTAPPYRPGQGPDGPCPVDGRPRSASCHTAHMTGSPGSTPRIPCVGALIYDAAGRLLLVQRGREPARGSWSIPGGKVEPGESPHAAVVREVWEETGLDVEPLALVGTVERAVHFTASVAGSMPLFTTWTPCGSEASWLRLGGTVGETCSSKTNG